MYPPCMHDVLSMRSYERLHPECLDEMRRAWRVAFDFDRFDLFDAVIHESLERDRVADWSTLFNLAMDPDLKAAYSTQWNWPDSRFFRDRAESVPKCHP